jgi:lipoprotein-releasing system permease protein
VQPFPLFLALKHIRRRALQSLLTVMGVAVGVMVLVTALSLTNGFIAELVRSTLKATPHIALSALPGQTIDSNEAVLEKLQAYSEVLAVSPYISTQALIFRRANAELGLRATKGYTQIIGIDPTLEQQVLPALPELAQQAKVLMQQDAIVLGSSLGIRQLGVIPGDEVFILNEDQRRKSFTVVDTFRVGNELIDSVVSYTSIPTLQDYLRAEGQINGYHIRLKDENRASQVGLKLAADTGLMATSWQVLFGGLIDQLKMQKALIAVVVFLIVLVAAMGIANILILTVAEKTQEIAILRAMGASQRQILTTFTLEGFLLGGTGTLLGALLGFLISLYFKLKPFPLPGDLYFITALPVQMQPFDFIWVCVLSLFTSIVAGIVPARRASGLNPVDILR